MKSHIGFLIPNLQSGGVQKVITIIANAMVERGHRIDIIVLGETGELLDQLDKRIEVVVLDGANLIVNPLAGSLTGFLADPLNFGALWRHLLALRNRSKSLRFLLDLVRYLEQNEPDTLFSATPLLNMDAVLAKKRARVSTRLIVSERSHLSTGKPRKHWRAKKLQKALSYCYEAADQIHAVSFGVADDLAKTLGIERSKITVLHNPTIPSDVAERAALPVDHSWFEENDPPLLLAIGRPSHQKDYETLIEALAIVNKVTPVRLAIIGSTLNTRKRKERVFELLQLAQHHHVEDNLSFVGWRGNVFPYIARATILVLSSRWEGLPNVLLEALACGTPIVSTDCPSGPHEILDGGKYGKLVPIENPEALAAGIIQTLNDPPSKSHLLDRAAQFDREASIHGYEQILTANLPQDDTPAEERLREAS